jgi:hypothetical protein
LDIERVKDEGSSSVPLPETGTEGFPARKFFFMVMTRSIAAIMRDSGDPPPLELKTLTA